MNLSSIFSLENLKGIIWLTAMLVTHEFGHYWIAKRHGIYKGLGFFLGGMCVNMTTYLPNRWEYLYGILFSFISFPLYAWLRPPKAQLWMFLVFALAIGVVDILVFIFYKPIIKAVDKEEELKNATTRKDRKNSADKR